MPISKFDITFNVVLLSQIAGYVIGLILSLCIIVPMSLHHHEFSGHCLLFSEGIWQENDGNLLVTWASVIYCNYVLSVGVLMFIICCVQIYRLTVLLLRGRDSSFLSAFLEAVGCAILCLLTIIAAIFITLGFMTWCQTIVQRFPSCEVAAGQKIDEIDKIFTDGFYIQIGTAQFGAWAAFATWVGLAVFSTLKLCRYHQLENIRVSMYHERQRLVNENETSSVASTTPTAERHQNYIPPDEKEYTTPYEHENSSTSPTEIYNSTTLPSTSNQ